MKDSITYLGRWVSLGIADFGGAFLFFQQVINNALRKGVRFRYFIEQMYEVGVRSVPTTVTAGLFVGAILAIQLNAQLKDYGAQSALGGLTTSTMIRNIGPVLIAFMLSGKIGAYTTAELATLRVTQQMDALRCLGVDPQQLIIVPRLLAIVCGSFCLLLIGLMVGLGGGIAVSSLVLDVNPIAYLQRIPQYVSGWSVGTGVIKALVYGVVIGWIACYRGVTAEGGAAGVGRAVKRASVDSLVVIILLDFILSSLSTKLYDLWGSY